jgi:hypothetical protein
MNAIFFSLSLESSSLPKQEPQLDAANALFERASNSAKTKFTTQPRFCLL